MHDDEIISADPDFWIPQDSDRQVHVAVTADGAPMAPPLVWFDDPTLNRPTALIVEPDGRVYGHIACWDTKHIGMPGAIRPPKSKSNYAFFATGALHTAEGKMVNVGQITLVGGHAPIDVDVPRAVAHYDDTQSGVCDVSIGEDRHGIWVAGALRPDVDDKQIRQLRASAVSGDWRPINGNLELVAVCSVNVPGFPIPRARVASGQTVALVAAGVEPLIEDRLRGFGMQNQEEIDGILAAVAERIERLETWILSIADPTNSTSLNASADVPEDLGAQINEVDDVTGKIEDLRRRVRAPMIASLRSRVYGTDTPVTAGAKKFVPDLHPRGRDGKFIKKFGFVRYGNWDKRDNRGERAGRVMRVDTTPEGTRVSVRDDKTGTIVSLKPEQIISSYAPKASLNTEETALTPRAARFMDLLGESIPAKPDYNDITTAVYGIADEDRRNVTDLDDEDLNSISQVAGPGLASQVIEVLQDAVGYDLERANDEAMAMDVPMSEEDQSFDANLTIRANTLMSMYASKANAGTEDADEAITEIFDENPEFARELDDDDLETLALAAGPEFASLVADKMSEVRGYDLEMSRDQAAAFEFDPVRVQAARDAATAESYPDLRMAVFPDTDYEWNETTETMEPREIFQAWVTNPDGSQNGGRLRFSTAEEAQAYADQSNKLTDLREGEHEYYTMTPIEEQRALYEELKAKWGDEPHFWTTLEDFAPADREDAAKLRYWEFNRVFENPMQASAADLRMRVHGETDRAAIIAAGLRSRVHNTALTAGIKGKFNPNLHPRGKDGKFISKLGFVKFFGKDDSEKRGKVVGIDEGKSGNTEILVETNDGSTFTLAPNEIEAVASTKATISGKTPDAPESNDSSSSEDGLPAGSDPKIPAIFPDGRITFVPLRGSLRDHIDSGGESLDIAESSDAKISSERLALHSKIIDKILDVPKNVENPEFVFLGGGPASGKTSLTKSGLISLPPDHASVNADVIKEDLPEFGELIAARDKRGAGYTHEESSGISSVARQKAVQQGSNVVLDGTGDSDVGKMQAKIEDARSRGYKITGRYVSLPVEVALERADERWQDEKSDSFMRWVAPSIIESAHMHVTNTTLGILAKGLFDDYELYDTNVPRGEPPRLVARADRETIEIVDEDLWQQFVAKGTIPVPEELTARIIGGSKPPVTAAADVKTPDRLEPMRSDYLYIMASEITLGVPKEDSRFTDEPGFSERWDRLEQEINDAPEGVYIDIPHEVG